MRAGAVAFVMICGCSSVVIEGNGGAGAASGPEVSSGPGVSSTAVSVGTGDIGCQTEEPGRAPTSELLENGSFETATSAPWQTSPGVVLEQYVIASGQFCGTTAAQPHVAMGTEQGYLFQTIGEAFPEGTTMVASLRYYADEPGDYWVPSIVLTAGPAHGVLTPSATKIQGIGPFGATRADLTFTLPCNVSELGYYIALPANPNGEMAFTVDCASLMLMP
jgi:hypothetical protein